MRLDPRPSGKVPVSRKAARTGAAIGLGADRMDVSPMRFLDQGSGANLLPKTKVTLFAINRKDDRIACGGSCHTKGWLMGNESSTPPFLPPITHPWRALESPPPKGSACCLETTARAFSAVKTGARAYTSVPVRGRAPPLAPSQRSSLHS